MENDGSGTCCEKGYGLAVAGGGINEVMLDKPWNNLINFLPQPQPFSYLGEGS